MNTIDLTDLEVLTLTIYGEARGEPIEGQIAVGCVIRNRVVAGLYISYKAACLAPLQFSCWNLNDPNYPILEEIANKMSFSEIIGEPVLNQCYWVATGIIHNSIKDNTHGSRNYLTTELLESNPPSWAKRMKIVETIGNQTFLV